MSPFYFVLLLWILACLATFIIIFLKHRAKRNVSQIAEALLDDTSYIQKIEHLSGKVGFVTWQQYDILLAACPYGWETMVDLAAYLESADIDKIDSITVADMPDEQPIELSHIYNQAKVGLKNFDKLTEEKSMLSIAGHSRTLNESIKIVWFNQTNVLRVFTLTNDETLITKYVETVIRRTFGTEIAMKLAKPVASL
jgi:hypothetical protein